MSNKPADHARRMFEALGWQIDQDPELTRTPERFSELVAEFANFKGGPRLSTFPADSSDVIAVTAIAFRSLCVHHVMPFFGFIDVAYVPDTTACGFGGILRVIEHFSHRPQVQEKLVHQVAEHLSHELNAQGVLVRCRARQMCVEMRRTDAAPVFVTAHALGNLVEGTLRDEALATFAGNEPRP